MSSLEIKITDSIDGARDSDHKNGGNQMSEEVLLYQISIVLSGIAAGLLFGKKGAQFFVIGWTIWTLGMVFTKSLFILQGLTIFTTWIIISRMIDSPKYHKYQKNFIRAIAGISALTVLLGILAIFLKPTTNNDSRYPSSESYNTLAGVHPEPFLKPPSSDQKLYNIAVANVELLYPELNPDMPAYTPAAVEAVRARMKFLVNQGILSHIAVQRAADEYFSSDTGSTGTLYKCTHGVYQDFPCAR